MLEIENKQQVRSISVVCAVVGLSVHIVEELKCFAKWRFVTVLTLFLAVSACSSTNIPGGYVYGIDVTSKSGSLQVGKGGHFEYGRYRGKFGRSGGGGKRGIGYLSEFYPLKVEWISTSGVERKESLDIAALVNGVKQKMVFAPSYKSSVNLLVYINGESLNVYFVHRRGHDLGKVSSDHTRFLLFESEGNSQ